MTLARASLALPPRIFAAVSLAPSSTAPAKTVQMRAHGAAVRQLSGDPKLGELMVMNYRAALLDARQRAMLDFAVKMTEESHRIEESDREALREVGFTDKDIWDIAAVAGFYNMTNRMSSAVDMRPNDEYHGMAR